MNRMESALDGADSARRGLRQDLADQQQSIEAMERAFGVLRAQVGRSQEAWVLAEAEYLLHVANQRLQLARDVDTALAALATADQRLQELANAAYLPVREQISRELGALRSVNEPEPSTASPCAWRPWPPISTISRSPAPSTGPHRAPKAPMPTPGCPPGTGASCPRPCGMNCASWWRCGATMSRSPHCWHRISSSSSMPICGCSSTPRVWPPCVARPSCTG
ncbi:hypothetical protein D6C00_07845 [Thiohalobacter thiocyanaticus]|uniref:Uncharacterized protein n=1 Tax=Thiohalobacter thiocyanaticus TaxID=585455 RepID=A0A426QJE2_9GAMM|nr:hypothetical protein D6C00_07845 [Thiohalobacter thiocyanaticus]